MGQIEHCIDLYCIFSNECNNATAYITYHHTTPNKLQGLMGFLLTKFYLNDLFKIYMTDAQSINIYHEFSCTLIRILCLGVKSLQIVYGLTFNSFSPLNHLSLWNFMENLDSKPELVLTLKKECNFMNVISQ